MKKSSIIAIVVIALIVIVAVIAVVAVNSKPKTNLAPINSAEDLSALVDKLYEGQENLYSSLATQVIDVTDSQTVQACTGLEDGSDLEYLVISEPMISAQAHSLVLAKVKDGVNANDVAKTMSENINMAKWVCVSAERLCATSSGDVVCLVMSNEEMAKSVYEKFVELAGNIGEQYEKVEAEIELPPDMY